MAAPASTPTLPNLIGRLPELEHLLAGLSAVTGAGGRGRLILLEGEPGIGKTRLCDELAHRAAAAGATVAWGAAWDGGGAPAYWPWTEVLRALATRLPPPDETLRRALGPLWPGEPAAGNDGAEADRDPELARFRRDDALRAVLQAAAARAPLVVVFEDLHAADRASLLALQLCARALRSLPVLLLATHRPAAALPPELGELVARLAREGETLSLRRLGRADVAGLLAGLDPVPEALIDEIYQASGGNPLFVHECVRLVRSGGRLSSVPAGVSALIREHLAHYEAGTRALLEQAAVMGRELTLAALAAAAGLEASEVEAELRRPAATGVLERLEDAGGGPRVRFAHGLYRERLLEDLTPERRAALHLAAARALLRRRAGGHLDAEEPLARHLLAAGRAADAALTVEWASRAAGRAAASLAFDRAVALYEGALTAATRLPAELAPARTLELELALGETLARTGAGARSRAICRAAAEHAQARGDAVGFARAALAYGAELRLAVVDEQLVALLRAALAGLGDARDDLRARVLARLAAAQQPAPDPQTPVAEARAAIALARKSGDAETLLAALHSAGSAMVDFAPPEERLPLARELCTLALPRGELTLCQQGYARVAIDCFELGDRAGARAAIEAHERLGRALGAPRWRWRGTLLRAMVALVDGRWQEARTAADEAGALIAMADDAGGAATLALHRLGAARASETLDEAALAAGEAALGHLPYVAALLPFLRASLLAARGDAAGARRNLALGFGNPAALSDPVAVTLAADALSWLDQREDKRDDRREDDARVRMVLDALAAFDGPCMTWGVFGLIFDAPLALWTGALARVLGRADEAVAALEEARALAGELEAPPLAARVRYELARARLLRGGSDAATRAGAELAEAAATCTALGLERLGARVADLRAAAAAASAPVTAPAPAALAGAGPRAAAGAVVPPRPEPPVLVREGEIWTIRWQGHEVRLKHSRALELLATLVAQPGREIHVLALGAGEAAEGEAIDTGDAGELLDADARDAYRARIAELGRELDEARAWADQTRRDRLRAELEFLEDELARAVGKGGRPRRAGAAAERARSNVQKRLRGLIRKIREVAPSLADHLDREVRTGNFVSYGLG